MRLAQTGVTTMVAVTALLACATAAFAYPNPSATYPAGVARTDCADCHGRESGESTDTVAATRKGPHGGYTRSTNKCMTCHSVKSGPAGGVLLLPGATVKATCESCHDGTGGVGVYGAIEARGGEVAAGHSVEETTTIPGGDPSGGPREASFSGPGGTLTCSDCHSPHDFQTVEPFVGDRLRAEVASDTVYALATNRLLKQLPTSSETTVSVYGAGWCASCHRGRATQHAEDSGLMQTHPVMAVEGVGADEYNYGYLPVVASEESTETTIGALGQSNRGYVMPEGGDGPGSRTELQEGRAPLCQQCHEDARNVGPSERGTNPTVSQDQTFTVSVYSPELSAESTGNPQFTVFPHESNVEYFLVRPVEPAVEDTSTPQNALCLNCHSLLHEVPPGYEGCLVCHDEGDAVDIHALTVAGCGACHLTGQPLTSDCATCHGPDPHPDIDHTVGFVSASMDFFTDRHRGQNRPAWVVDSVDCAMGCHSDDLVAVHDKYDGCVTCHPGVWDTYDPAQGCQQSGCHPTYHADALVSHNPYATNPLAQDHCESCHVPNSNDLLTNFCLNCHTLPAGTTVMTRSLASTDATPPVTTSDAQKSYVGPAYIRFTITVDGEEVDGTTSRRVDGGRLMHGPGAFVGELGTHSIEFWSTVNGVTEEPSKSVTIFIVEDTSAPVTVSDAQSSYIGSATITLTPTDNSYLGARYTYYRLDGGQIQVGTVLEIPAPESGTALYTLEYWSEDWSGNIEAPANMVIFTVASDT